MNKFKTLHVTFQSGPCAGKSTYTASIFSKLKQNKIHAEMIDEYAKSVVQEDLLPKLKNQIYLFSKQHKKQLMLDKKVEVVITDSALPLVLMYDKGKTKFLKELVMSEFNKFNNLNIFLKRDPSPDNYTEIGRAHNLQQAIEIDNQILDFLKQNEISYIEIESKQENIDVLFDIIKTKIHNDNN